ncbi:MAG: MFS transporter [Pirellulaceae bacterium]|nr:MFS transporter [Pirellulaceae bacterium]
MLTLVRLAKPPKAPPVRAEDAYDRQSSLRPNLRASVYDAGFYGLMVGIGEAYLPAFALAIGLGEVVSGLVTSVPILLGGILQLLSIYALSWVGSYKRWIVAGIIMQAFAFFPLIYAAFVGSISAWGYFAVASCYWGAGMASGPAWNAWISHVVPSRIRSHYFARRTRVIQLATLGGFLFAGWLLQMTKEWDMVLYGFATIFIIAVLARFASAFCLERHKTSAHEDHAEPRTHRLWNAWTHIPPKARYLICYLVCMQGCIQFSGPYFIPYMLKQLDFSYTAFVAVIAGALVARACCMSLWGLVARNYGSQTLLWIGGLGLVPLSSLWTLSDSIAWLVTVQIVSGILWAAYELAFFLMFLDYIPQRKRSDMLTIYNFAHAVAWCLGALLGGWWISSHGTTPAAYHGVFIVSAIGRCACVGLLWMTWRSTVTSPTPIWPVDTAKIQVELSETPEFSSGSSGTSPNPSPMLDIAAKAA